MSRHAMQPANDIRGMTLTPRLFARIVGGLLLLGAVIALALPISVNDGSDTVKCGDGFKGVSQEASLHDAGQAISDAMNPEFADPDRTPVAEQCGDAVSTRRAWGWPAGVVGLVVLAGSFVVFAPQRPAGESAA